MGKWELTMEPVQEWGEEYEDDAVFGITLRREPVPQAGEAEGCVCSAFMQYRTYKVRRLKAATLKRLVDHLVEPCCQENHYGRILLSTYHTFTSSSELIQMLFQRDVLTSGLNSSECHKSALWTLLQTWLDEYVEDFRDPPMHSSLRLMCLHLRRHSSLSPLAKCYEALLKRFQAEDIGGSEEARLEKEPAVDQEEKDSERDDLTSEADFMDFSPTGLAEQLTRLDAELFMKVVPFQCLGCVWSQRDKKENLSPTIRATIAQFNAITNRVITSLLCHSTSPSSPSSTPTQRARDIEKWIQVAQECRQLKNFSSLRAILSALQSNPVYRLRQTWAAVSRDSMSIFENLCETFPDENCVLSSREILLEDGSQAAVDNISPKASKQCPMPGQTSTNNRAVPYLGTFLTVLTMLDTALPDTVEHCGLINFEKRRREYEILWQIRQLQASCSHYVLPRHPQIEAWLRNPRQLTEQESYEFSRQLEPPLDTSPPSSGGAWGHRTLTKKLSALLSTSESPRKNADQISVSSSGSSSSEMEEISTSQSSPPGSQSLSGSCQNMVDAPPSTPSPDYTTPPLGYQADPVPPSPSSSSAPSKMSHKRSISMTVLPAYNRQVADSCIIRVSVDPSSNGNMYKSILLTNQDKTGQVIERALQKHNLENSSVQDFALIQILPQGKELIIPDKANVFYAMCTSATYDFVLRRSSKGQWKHLARSASLSSSRSLKSHCP